MAMNAINMDLIQRFTTPQRSFKVAPDNRFITVYVDGRFNGFIFNNDRIIYIGGNEVNASEFFK